MLRPPILSKTKLFNNVFNEHVIAFVTDSAIDFVFEDSVRYFSSEQTDFLLRHYNIQAKKVVNIKQVHGDRIIYAHDHNIPVTEADGIITNVKNLPIAVRTADCLPIFLYDKKSKAIGIVHAGWKGTHKKIVVEAISEMSRRFKTQAEDLHVAIGPGICAEHYEVGPEFLDYFPEDVIRKDSKLYFDNSQVSQKQILSLGVPQENIFNCGICTWEDERCFSYRRQKAKAGRMLSVMMLK